MRFESQIALSLVIVAVYSAVLAVFEGITRIDLLPRSSYGFALGGNGGHAAR